MPRTSKSVSSDEDGSGTVSSNTSTSARLAGWTACWNQRTLPEKLLFSVILFIFIGKRKHINFFLKISKTASSIHIPYFLFVCLFCRDTILGNLYIQILTLLLRVFPHPWPRKRKLNGSFKQNLKTTYYNLLFRLWFYLIGADYQVLSLL